MESKSLLSVVQQFRADKAPLCTDPLLAWTYPFDNLRINPATRHLHGSLDVCASHAGNSYGVLIVAGPQRHLAALFELVCAEYGFASRKDYSYDERLAHIEQNAAIARTVQATLENPIRAIAESGESADLECALVHWPFSARPSESYS